MRWVRMAINTHYKSAELVKPLHETFLTSTGPVSYSSRALDFNTNLIETTSHLVVAQQRGEKPESRKREQAIVSAAFVQVILDEVESFVLKEHREKVLIFTCK